MVLEQCAEDKKRNFAELHTRPRPGGCTGSGSPGRRAWLVRAVLPPNARQTAKAPSHDTSTTGVAPDSPRRLSRTVHSLPTPASASQRPARRTSARPRRRPAHASPKPPDLAACRYQRGIRGAPNGRAITPRPLSPHPRTLPPTAHRRSLARVHLPSPPPFFHGRQCRPPVTTRPLPPFDTAAAAGRRCRLPSPSFSFLFRRAAYGGPPARCVGRPKRAKRGGQRLAPACGRRGGGGRGVVRGAV